MSKILPFIEKATHGKRYKYFKYCFEGVDVPKIRYDDKSDGKGFRIGETDKSSNFKNLEKLAQEYEGKPLFRFFLDGSRKTYKIDDIAYSERLYPVVAGQIGVGCCERADKDTFKKFRLDNQLVLSLPDCADKDGFSELFFNNQLAEMNKLEFLKKRNIQFQTILTYSDRKLNEGEEYTDKGIAKIQERMYKVEMLMVKNLCQDRKLNYENYLLKDGSLEYSQPDKDFSLSALKSNYQCVVGVSKSFNPELSKDAKGKNIAVRIAEMPAKHRTPAFMYEVERIKGVKFSV